ncbi:hypothetical protein BDZ97DRAFT_1914189 [Flammula alnicola]|nr:hypothetical protein BDZ97DRAFT_1914189 [Flammula alnicola]
MIMAGISPQPFFFDFRAAVSMVHESPNGLELQDSIMRTEWEEGARSPSLGYVRLGTNTPLDRLWMSIVTHEGSRATDSHSRTPQTPTNTPGPPVDAYNPPTNTNTRQHCRSMGSGGTRRGIQAVGGPPAVSPDLHHGHYGNLAQAILLRFQGGGLDGAREPERTQATRA